MEELFSPLPAGKSRCKAFVVSWGGQLLALLVALNINLLYPQALPTATMMLTHLVGAPPPVSHEPQKVNPKLLPKPKPLPVPVTETHLRLPDLPKPLKTEAPVKAPQLSGKPVSLPALPRVDTAAPRVIATNVFSTGSSATPTTQLPASKVQTGGFGDPNGIPATGKPGKPANIAALGSFDLPSGPGYGNGTGGSRGAKGVVASAGFGNGVAIGSGSGGVSPHEVHQGGFGDARPVVQPAKEKVPAVNPSPVTPVEIVYKPNPVYTDEGRRLKVEGEVKLEVIFTATGKVQVLRVLEGLGHGLDEAAVRAAQQIRFKPAKREGQAIDSSATLRIIFQLA